MNVQKYIENGKVAILYSPGYGAGWSTWGDDKMAYDRDLVEAYINGGVEELIEITNEKYPGNYLGGADGVEVVWMAQGTQFRINEYDGSESIEYFGMSSFMVA